MEGKIKGKWLEENMKYAMQKVVEGSMSLRKASSQFSVPKSTLQDRIKSIKSGKEVQATPQMGRFQMTFSEHIEGQLVAHLTDLDSRLMPMNKKQS